jgi:hypothetical protein
MYSRDCPNIGTKHLCLIENYKLHNATMAAILYTCILNLLCPPAAPTKPSLTCFPPDYVPVNTSISCTCTTVSLGAPLTGHLTFRSGTNNNINSVINSGNNGVAMVTMTSQTLTLADHNVRRFRCDADWASTVSSEVIVAQVGCKSHLCYLSNLVHVCSLNM